MTLRNKIPLHSIVPVFILLPFFVKIKILYITLKSGIVASSMGTADPFDSDDLGADDLDASDGDEDGYFGGVGV
jgi:hypothetical protein